MKRLHFLSAVATASLLTACGGGDSPTFIAVPTTGALKEPAATVTTVTAAQIDAGTAQSGLQAISGKARCDVKVVSLNYSTVGPKGEATNASGVLLVPTGTCITTTAPLVAYAKGTDVQKPRTLVNPQDPETFLLMAMYAAQGYAVVATDYLGYAKSSFSYHPFLHADSEARTVLDSVRAARLGVVGTGTTLSGKVMFAGYSQGGHSSMAAHRAAERDNPLEFDVAAGAHLAGPYNVSGSFKVPNAIVGYQFFAPFIVTSYQKVYGDAYTDVNTAFKPPYASSIENLLPNPALNASTLVSTGALPGANGETPNQVRDLLFQGAFLTDVQTNPNNPLYLDAKKNDLFGWSPRAKTLLCGGAGDPTVPTAVHMVPMKADFDARGVTTVTTVDVDAQVQAAFGPGGKAPTDPTSAAFATYYGSYHGSYESPFCHARARALFDTVK
ncbi:MAG: esterase [Variovorax sp.]|nr:MAG: esterase [Variovorax sp.]